MTQTSPRAADQVEDALRSLGLPVEPHTLPADARTVQQTAEALAAAPGQIVKAIAVREAGAGAATVVLAAGTDPIDLGRLGERLGRTVELVPFKQVEDAIGFPAGTVPPVGLRPEVRVVFDDSVPASGLVFTGAGVPGVVLAHEAEQLRQALAGTRPS